MTTPSLPAALSALEDIEQFIKFSELRGEAVKQILARVSDIDGAAQEWAQRTSTFSPSRSFDYVCVVIVLYGILERYIEDASEEFVKALCKCTEKYGDLPEKLRVSHFELAVEHLKRTKDARYDGNTSAIDLAASLSGCLAGTVPYSLLTESFLHHTSNFRVSTVDEFLGRLGITGASRRAVLTEEFSRYLIDAGKALPTDRPEAALDLINVLVSLRNEVAHGSVSNTLAPSELLPYCSQVSAYCKSLATVIDEATVGYLAALRGVDHGLPIAVYRHCIVCINTKGVVLRPGSELAIRRTDSSWYRATVLKIEIGNSPVDSTPDGTDVAVGLEIDGRCKDTYTIKSGVFSTAPVGVPVEEASPE